MESPAQQVVLLDGLFLPCYMLQPIAGFPANQRWDTIHLNLVNVKSSKKWHGFLFWECHPQQTSLARPRLYQLDDQTGAILYRGIIAEPTNIVFELNDMNSWHSIKQEKFVFRQEEVLHDFNVVNNDILIDGEKPLHGASAVLHAIINKTNDFVIVGENSDLFIVHLRGTAPQSLRLLPFQASNSAHMLVVCKQDTNILHLPTIISSREQDSFITILREQVQNKTHVMPLGQSECYLRRDDPRTLLWTQYLTTCIPPALITKMREVRIRLLHVESAWLRFQGQLLDMQKRKLSLEPRIMFHGVRAQNVEAVTKDIAQCGFNAKHGRVAVYGGGGIYCSPDAGCALGYVKNPKTGNTHMQNHLFVCLALPGKVGYNGKQDQPMAPDQNSWFALVPPYQVFSIEPNALLPIAEIIF